MKRFWAAALFLIACDHGESVSHDLSVAADDLSAVGDGGSDGGMCLLPALPKVNPDKPSPSPAAFYARYGSYPVFLNDGWSGVRSLWLTSDRFDTGRVNGGASPGYGEVFYGNTGDLFGDGSMVMVQAGWAVSTPQNQAGSLHLFTFDAKGAIVDVATTPIDGTTNPVIADWVGDGTKQILVPGYLDFNTNLTNNYVVRFDRTNKTFTKTMVGHQICSHNSFFGDWFGDGTPSLVGITYFDSSGTDQPSLFHPGSGQVVQEYVGPPNLSGSSIAFYDFDHDGKQDLITGDTNAYPSPWYDHASYIWYDHGDGGVPSPLPSPYFKSDAYLGADNVFQPYPGVTAADIRTHQVAIRVYDINRDGLPDIAISSILWSNYTPFGVVQMLIQQPDGSFVDETATRLYNFDMRQNGAHQIWFTDVNGDGYEDLVMSDVGYGTMDPPGMACASQSNQILINDGEGHFLSVMKDGFCKFAPYFYFIQKFLPWFRGDKFGFVNIDLNSPAQDHYLYTWMALKSPLGIGPGHEAPCVAGFNEWWYLLHHADAKAAVDAGTYSSGLAYYLAVGQARGDQIHAAQP